MTQTDPVLESLRQALAVASTGDPKAAQDAMVQLYSAHPSHLELGLSLAELHLDGGQIQGAIDVSRSVLRHHPKSVSTWCLLARALTQLRALTDAEAALVSALAVAPEDPSIHYQMGNICFQQGQFERAVMHLEKAQSGLANRPAILNDLGSARLALGRVDAAVEAFREAIRVKPSFAMAHANLGAALSYRGEIHTPLKSFLKATRLAPKDHRIWLKMGRTLLNQGHLDTAEKCLRRVLQFQPQNGAAQAALGTVLERSGRYEEAHELLDPLVQRNIQDTTAVVAWATTCRRLGRTDSAIPVLEGFMRGPRAQPERVLLGHTLGDLYDKMGQHEAAFSAHKTANQEHGLQFDPAQYHRSIDRIIKAFGPADFKRRPRAQNNDPTPVLIVGMPRSGTSLVEQVIDSHSQAAGAGELETLRRLSRTLVQRAGSAHWVKAMNTLDQPLADKLSAAYIARLREADATALRVTDKMPTNFLNLGLAAHLVPGARVIHCVRDPLDTALSCYFKLFNFGYAFSTQLDWLGHFIRGYQRLMQHWQTVLPLPILEVRYEDLVQDLEGGTRQILQFLELDWEENCLRFHENQRPVNTASYAQVRQPIYRSSMGRSAPYIQWLQPLQTVLDKST